MNKKIDFTRMSDKEIENFIEKTDLKGWKKEGLKEKEKLIKAAKNHVKKRKDRILNMRIREEDLNALKALALEEGLNYQALVTSILHKYINNQLVDIKNIKALVKEIKRA